MKVKKGIVLGKGYKLAIVACFAAVAAYGDIYDDAIFWFRGGTNVTANGRTAVKGDFFDSIHANDPTHKNHTASIWGYEDCRQGRKIAPKYTFSDLGAKNLLHDS